MPRDALGNWFVEWKPKQRVRKVTLAAAIAEARKAGIDAGVVTVDGVTVEFGNRVESGPDLANPWDEVLSNAAH